MIVRNAQMADKTEMLAESMRLARQHYPQLKADIAKAEATLRSAIAAGPHYCRVVEKDGKVVAALVGLVHDGIWAQRRLCQIVLWYSLIPGAGIKLLRHFLEWLPEQRAIRVAGVYHDFPMDYRVVRLLQREGFDVRGAALVRYN